MLDHPGHLNRLRGPGGLPQGPPGSLWDWKLEPIPGSPGVFRIVGVEIVGGPGQVKRPPSILGPGFKPPPRIYTPKPPGGGG